MAKRKKNVLTSDFMSSPRFLFCVCCVIALAYAYRAYVAADKLDRAITKEEQTPKVKIPVVAPPPPSYSKKSIFDQ